MRVIRLSSRDVLLLAITAIAITTTSILFGVFGRGIDIDVYRLGARVLLSGHELYVPGALPPGVGGPLPFTYPPISAWLFVPFAPMTTSVALGVMTAINLVLMPVVAAMALRGMGIALTVPRVLMATAPLLAAEPVLSTLSLGQVNIVLAALVLCDCLVLRGTRWHGVLIGVAGAIKLTPLVILAFLLVRRDWRAIVVAVASFIAVGLLGLLLSWRDSIEYWGTTLFQTKRIGSPAFASNQSLSGFFARLHWDAHTAVTISATLAVVLLGLIATWHAVQAGQWVIAVGVVAMIGLVGGPVVWTHHWVLAAVLVLALLVVGYRSRNAVFLALGGVGAAAMLIAPTRWVPQTKDREYHWAWWQHVVGESYLWWGLGTLVVLALPWAWRSLKMQTREPVVGISG